MAALLVAFTFESNMHIYMLYWERLTSIFIYANFLSSNFINPTKNRGLMALFQNQPKCRGRKRGKNYKSEPLGDNSCELLT